MMKGPKEIERKYLVKHVPRKLRHGQKSAVAQGYLAIQEDGREVRIRNRDKSFFLTIKHGFGISRREEEIELTAEQFRRLWPLTKGRRIEKDRILFPIDGHTAEIDIYKGKRKGLIVAEIEFANIAKAKQFRPPRWFDREVTEMAEYKNQHLAS